MTRCGHLLAGESKAPEPVEVGGGDAVWQTASSGGGERRSKVERWYLELALGTFSREMTWSPETPEGSG